MSARSRLQDRLTCPAATAVFRHGRGRDGEVETKSRRACDVRRAANPAPRACADRSHPQKYSRKSELKTRNTTKISASLVLEEIRKSTASGPVISVSSVNGLEIKVSPSPIAAKLISASSAGGCKDRVCSLGSR